MHSLLRLLAPPLLAVSALVPLSGCGSSVPTTPQQTQYLHNIAQIQTAIEDTLRTKQNITGTAYCPQLVPAISGETFSCVVAIKGQPPAVFNVTEANAQGAVNYVRVK